MIDASVIQVFVANVNAMLLNEFLKEHKKTEKLEASVASLIATVKDQAAQIQKVSARLETVDLRRKWSTIPKPRRSLLLTHIAATDKRFVVHADEKLTAFLELESVISGSLLTSCNGSVG